MSNVQREIPAPNRLWGWLPTEVLWLVGAGILFHFLAQIHWEKRWEGFAYDVVLRWYLPLAFWIAALYAWLGTLPEWRLGKRLRIRSYWGVEIALSFVGVLYLKYINPIGYIDDAGFILRYLDHFKEGCFFCFNIDDGPVFGLSSFIYGLLGGFMTWTGLFNAEGAVNYLTYAGTFFTGFLYFRILRIILKSDGIILLMWVMLMTCSRAMGLIYSSGMEAPVHFSIVLAAVLFFLQKRDRLMWLFMAISVISKLDAVPVVVVLAAFWTVENWKDLLDFQLKKRRYWDAILYGLVPVLMWIVFAKIVFGSPLPQSAFAKIYIHAHSTGSWFPFLDSFLINGYRSPFIVLSVGLFLAQIGWVAATKKEGRHLVFGFGFIATLVLYYFYNPGERMVWYYVLPEGLMLLQLAVGLQWVWGAFSGNLRLAGICLVTGFAFMFTWIFMTKDIDYSNFYVYVVEAERGRIGDYLEQRAQPEDTVQSGHGLISRKVRGYVVDETGLNFRLDTTSKDRNVALWEKYKPDWIVMHGYSWEVNKLNNYNYILDSSFFDITTFGYPAWRVFRKTASHEEAGGTYYPQRSEIVGDQLEFFDEMTNFLHAKANAFTFVRGDYNRKEAKLTMGFIRRDRPFNIHVRDVFPGDTTLWEHTYVVDSFAGLGTSRVMGLTIPLLRTNVPADMPQGQRKITVTFENNNGPVDMYDPAVTVLNREP